MPAKRGRKSAAAIATVAKLPNARPEAPAILMPDQAEEWTAIVARMPADWFTRENQALLIELCRAISRANKLAIAINAFDPEWLTQDAGLKQYDALSKLAQKEAGMVATLSTKMRLTQQSRWNAKSADTAARNRGAGSGAQKPWEK